MKKATNINELVNNLNPNDFLKPEDRDVYVPIYDDILKILRDMLIHDRVESQTFFVAGQSGTGKTTALNFFGTDNLEMHYHIEYINMREFLEIDDVDIIDFLLTFAFALVKETSLEEKYYKQLEKIQKKHEGDLVESAETESTKEIGAGATANLSIKGSFLNFIQGGVETFANIKKDSVYRHKAREVFNLKKPFLFNLINELLDNYVEEVTHGKKLLVIIDDLDKLKEVRHIKSIFVENRNYIFSLKCKKIISIPTYLTKIAEISNYSQYPIRQFILRLHDNPFDLEGSTNEKIKYEPNWKMLQDVIRLRIEEGHSLIDDDALEKAIKYSGGIIRQLIKIVHQAAVNVRVLEGRKISRHDIEEGIELLKNEMANTIASSPKILMLNRVREKNIPASENADDFIELLHANNVLVYVNGGPWYEVNPIIEKTVEVYASKIKIGK
jgi:hypothetical protein